VRTGLLILLLNPLVLAIASLPSLGAERSPSVETETIAIARHGDRFPVARTP